MFRKNNKGLSLVELIVAVAILAIVGVAIMGFVAFSSRNYSQANKNVKLQYEQQMTVNHIRDIVLETSRGIAYDDTAKALTVFSDTAGSSIAADGVDSSVTPIIVSRIYFTEAATGEEAGSLHLLNVYLGADDIKDKKYSDISISGTGVLLTDTIKDFSADLSDVGKGKVTLHITFKVGSKEVTVHPEIALRNIIDIMGDDTEVDKLYDKDVIEFSSNVAKVEISRDGKVFGQAKTDTVAMAGDSTTVDYDAIVTKKSYYKGDILTTVKWELDGLKSGYENNIILDEATGRITFKNTSDGKTPADYIDGTTFVLKAISDEDPTKIGRLRIKVTTGGIYPVSIDYAETHKQDLTAAQLVYTFTHSIEYTDFITNSAGASVNPLTGSDVYTKIQYTVFEADKVTPADIPKSAGFSSTKIDGVFRVVKSMEEHTYMIKVSVLQKDKDGNEVACWIQLDIPKGAVPDNVTEFTIPQLYTTDEYKRADYNAASVQWTNGIPTYTAANGDKSQYYVYYEWEIEPVSGFSDEERSKFKDNLFFADSSDLSSITPSHLGTWSTSDGKDIDTYSTDYKSRISTIFVRPRLDWTKKYTARVNLRALLAKSNKSEETYYTVKSNGTKRIYKNDAPRNEVIQRFDQGTLISSSDIDYNQWYGSRVKYNGTYRYIDTADISLSEYASMSGRLDVYSNDWGGYAGTLWPIYLVGSIRILDYHEYQNYPYKVEYTYEVLGIRNTRQGWVSASQLQINYITNKATELYENRIEGDGYGKNETIVRANGGEELTILGESNDRYHVKVKIGQTEYDGYIFKSDVSSDTRPVAVTKEYYKLPTDVNDLDNITTSNRSEAYVSSQLVTINPVTLSLTPAAPTLSDKNNHLLTVYSDTRDTVYLGKGKYYNNLSGYNPNNSAEAYKYYGVTKNGSRYRGYRLDYSENNMTYYSDYYKCYIPTFTGLNVTVSNVDKVLGGVRKSLDAGAGTVSSLQPWAYVTIGSESIYQAQDISLDWFDCGYLPNNSGGADVKPYKDYNVYLYVKMTPYYWSQKFNPFPTYITWDCVVDGKDTGNFVKAGSKLAYNGEYGLDPK